MPRLTIGRVVDGRLVLSDDDLDALNDSLRRARTARPSPMDWRLGQPVDFTGKVLSRPVGGSGGRGWVSINVTYRGGVVRVLSPLRAAPPPRRGDRVRIAGRVIGIERAHVEVLADSLEVG